MFGILCSSLCCHVLIETSWNVKRKYFPAIPYTAVVLIETSWNVKSSPRALLIRFFFVLIETSWNVKCDLSAVCYFTGSVLIETSCNVKMHGVREKTPWYLVLIETSWNVKQNHWLFLPAVESRINRNIVECKGIYPGERYDLHFCINRNIVECKDVRFNEILGKAVFVLIETSWNVKAV